MARIRSVHPSFFTDEAVVSCSPLARLLYIGLWTDADDQGVFEWKPLQIKMRLLPGDNADTAALLSELVDVGLIHRQDVGAKPYGFIRDFRRFQRPKKPNRTHVLPDELRTYVGMDSDVSEPEEDQQEAVPHQAGAVPHRFPTSGEKSPQMEDGGEDVGKKEESFALSAAKAAEAAIGSAESSGKPPSKRTERAYPDDFEATWKAYPHFRGRSSKPNALVAWRKLPQAERDAMVAAIERFKPKVREVCGDKGAPDMARWLRDGKHLNWLDPAAEAVSVNPEAWPFMVAMWRRGDPWPLTAGPAPDRPDTLVPAHLLRDDALLPALPEVH